MSTRAIIGIQHADGSILGAWQWNDGNALTGLLNRKFNTLEKAQALVAEGSRRGLKFKFEIKGVDFENDLCLITGEWQPIEKVIVSISKGKYV